MRVISGIYRGKKLETIDDLNTRPTTDRVKENIFNLLPHSFSNDIKVLDVFSGSGAIGLEFISRGCGFVTLNDLSNSCVKVIKNNFSKVEKEKYEIFNFDAFNLINKLKKEYDFVYIDGPYNKYDVNKLLIDVKRVIKPTSLIILETDSEYVFNNLNFEIVKEKKYGKTKIWILRSV